MKAVRTVCRRGARKFAPENTFAAAQAALSLGGDIVELSVRQSIDKTLYVIHDELVDRTTDAFGPIAEMKTIEVDSLDAGIGFGLEFAGEEVPRLEQFLNAFRKRTGFYLRIMQANCEALAEVLERTGVLDRSFAFSGEPEIRAGMLAAAPKLRQVIDWSVTDDPAVARRDHGAAIYETRIDLLSRDQVAHCRDLGLEIMALDETGDPAAYRRVIELEADYIRLDELDVFLSTQYEMLGGQVLRAQL